jgi:hypothetical protein
MGIGLSKEAPHVLSLGGTSWRLYYDDYGSGGNRESFVESTDDWTTWGAVHDNGANQGVTDSASHNNVVAHGEVSVNSYSFP